MLTRNQSVGRNDVPKARFTSLQYQLKALIELGDEPKSVLEIGPGRGYFRVMGELLGYDVSTLDLDPENQPDYDCDIAELDMAGGFNVVCAFEVLEHMPYESSLKMFTEMLRLSSKWVVVSVPIKRNTWSLRVQIPERFIRRRFGTTWLRGGKYFSIRTELPKRSDLSLPEEGNWKPHHWELGRSSYPTGRLVRDLSNLGATLVQQFTNPSHDYHEYFVFEKK